eukprot:5947289-Prymnesium_polylepis.1
MYDCFKRDVERGREENEAIPKKAGADPGSASSQVRVVSFNVHYFRAGFSDVNLYDSFDEVVDELRRLDADILLLQEVPVSLLQNGAVEAQLRRHGYVHSVAAGSADVHVLSTSSSAFPNERLHVMIASRLELRQHE